MLKCKNRGEKRKIIEDNLNLSPFKKKSSLSKFKEIEDYWLPTTKEEDDIKRAIALSLQEANSAEVPHLDTSPNKPLYSLQSIVVHNGNSVAEGHYISDVYDPSAVQWKTFNDSVVRKVDKNTIFGVNRQKSAYVLFYVHKNCLP